jgi:hypothetical protein
VAFIEGRVKMYKRQRALREVVEIFKGLSEMPGGTGAKFVRGDRDSY